MHEAYESLIANRGKPKIKPVSREETWNFHDWCAAGLPIDPGLPSLSISAVFATCLWLLQPSDYNRLTCCNWP